MAQATLPRTGSRARREPGAGLGRLTLRGTAFLYLGLIVLLPVVAILQAGFSDGLAALRSALSSFGAWEAIRLSLFMALITAVVNGVMGTLLAYVLVRIKFPGRSVLSTIIDLPFAVPTLVAGVMIRAIYGPNSAMGGFLHDHGIDVVFTQIGILLALLFVTLPLVVRTVQPVLLELDPAEEEASRVLGAGRWTTFRRVMFPALLPAVAGGMLLTFARCLGEFGAIVIVSGNLTGKTLTAPVFIFQLTSQFKYAEAAAVSALLFSMAFVLVIITERLVSKRTAGYTG
jgi:sulfate transport system permease protein